MLIPEKNNQPSVEEAKTINLSDITDVDRKVELWRKVLGATQILPIHHFYECKETVSLISTSHENAMLFKKILLILLISGSPVDYVCPFSEGGKILLDKQPVNGSIKIDDEKLILLSEWLGKKQQEIIDLSQIDDFDTEPPGGVSPGRTSITLKYQKEGVLISTLITSDDRTIISLDKYIKLIKGIEEDEEVNLNEQQLMLVQLMYTSDIDAETAMQTFGVTMEDLKKIVSELLQMEIIRTCGDDEFELTEKGTRYIVEQMKKNIGGV